MLLGAACAGPPRGEESSGGLRRALTPGPISDQTWNGEADRGLLAIRDSLGASISHIQTRTPASFDENYREYGRQSYDLVTGHGIESTDAAERIAPSSRGADVIFQNADAAGLGVFQAARETGRALVIGSNADQNNVAPTAVLGSAVIDLPLAFLTVARTVRDRAPLPGVFALGAETRVVHFIVNPARGDRISPPARQRVDSVWTSMSSGAWQSPVSWRTPAPRP